MQSLGRRYVGYVNRRYARTGTLWEGRFKSTIVDAEDYVLACYRYIKTNPVRAQMVEGAQHRRFLRRGGAPPWMLRILSLPMRRRRESTLRLSLESGRFRYPV